MINRLETGGDGGETESYGDVAEADPSHEKWISEASQPRLAISEKSFLSLRSDQPHRQRPRGSTSVSGVIIPNPPLILSDSYAWFENSLCFVIKLEPFVGLLILNFVVFRRKVGTFGPFCWVCQLKFWFWICSGQISGGFVFGYADLMRRVSRWMGLSTMGACSVLGTCWCHGALVASLRSQRIGAVSLSLMKCCKFW